MKKLLIIAALLMSGVAANAGGGATCAMGSKISLFGDGASAPVASTASGIR